MNSEIVEYGKNEYMEFAVSEIKELLNKARNNVALQVNNELLATYWKIGEIIVYKLPDVCSIVELDPQTTVSRELMLIKMKNDPKFRDDIRGAIDAFEGKIVDYTLESLTIQMVGDSLKTDNFITIMKNFGILEICRTGVVSLERGSNTIRKVTNF